MLKNLFSAFKRTQKRADLVANATLEQPPAVVSDSWNLPCSASKLLNTPLRQQHLQTIWQNVSMSPELFQKLYQQPIEKFAEIVQLLPASESHHHSHMGGMLDHVLEVVSIAVRLRQNYVLPQNAAPEEQAKQRDVWTAIIIYAALLHDIGKIVVDIEIQLDNGQRWFPWQGVPHAPYKFRYIKERDYHLHPSLGGVFASYLLPIDALNWIASVRQAFSAFTYFISGHTDKAGLLSEIIQKADQISVTMALGGDPSKLSEKPKMSFAKQLHIALCHVVKNLKLNPPKGGEGWLTEDGLWAMSKTTLDNIRGYLMSQGISVPSQNSKLLDELQAYSLIEKTERNTAIWNCHIESASGWKTEKAFTVIKIPVSVIWENIDERPDFYKGRVIVQNLQTDNEKEQISEVAFPEFNEIDNVGKTGFKEDQVSTETGLSSVESETENEFSNDESVVTEPVYDIDAQNNSSDLDFVLELFPTNKEDTKPAPTVELSAEIITNVVAEDPPVETLHNPSNSSDMISGERFIQWLKAGIVSGKLNYNRPNAKVHIVENHLFLVTPSIFQVYLGEAGITDKPSWELLQKHFQNLGIHKRQHTGNDSRNIWVCSVVGPNRKSLLNGYLLENPKQFLGDKLIINNQWLTLEGN